MKVETGGKVTREGKFYLESNTECHCDTRIHGHVCLVVQDAYELTETRLDEGDHRTVVTIFLTPKSKLKGKGIT